MSAPLAKPAEDETTPRLGRLLGLLAIGIALFDGCFWGISETPGLSVAVFSLGLALLVTWHTGFGRITQAGKVLLGLIAGSAWAAALETGWTNTFSLILLFTALAGEMHFSVLSSSWARWQSQAVALLRAPGRLIWLGLRLLKALFLEGPGQMSSLWRGTVRSIPALLLALVFGGILAQGNSVFSHWTGSFFDAIWNRLWDYLNVDRMIFWLGGACLLLPLLRPVTPGEWWWRWTHVLPRFSETAAARTGIWTSALILGVLNVLFFVANLADLLFLWSGHQLPAGLTYTQFVHQGTNSLITVALLSAVVLTAIFQQALTLTRNRVLQGLACLWIIQNLFLLLSVVLRLKLYIEAYDMTVTRLSLLLFLVLVAVGYALLSIKIRREKSLSWLLGGALLAVTATFYLAQFLDLSGWTADYNVTHWEQGHRSRSLDVNYLYRLGPPAWPALARAHREDAGVAVEDPEPGWSCRTEDYRQTAFLDQQHWREWSLRARLNRWALQGNAAPAK